MDHLVVDQPINDPTSNYNIEYISLSNSCDSEDNTYMSHTTDLFNMSLSMETHNVPKPTMKPTVHMKVSHTKLYSPTPVFFIPLPNNGETMYTPIQAIHVINNNLDGSKRRILKLPKGKGKIVFRNLSKYGIIMMLI